MKDMKKVNDQFTVGMAPPSAVDLSGVAKSGYKSVMNLRCEGEPNQPLNPAQEGEEAKALGLEYSHIPVAGNAMTEASVDQFRKAASTLPGPIFVHCASGKRAGAFTMMHLAAESGMSGDETLQQAGDMGFACDEPALEKFVRDYVDGQQR